MDRLHSLPALELVAGFRERAFSPLEAIDALAERIAAVEPDLKAFLTLTLDTARTEAAAAERAYAAGTARPLEGVPIAVKDMFDTAGVRTTYGSPMYAGHIPAADAEAVRRVKDAGAIVVGKTSTHEFAWGITSYNAHFDSGRNPWDPTRISGGSSGGSGAAVAAREVPLALGTDTAGSIRAPAAFCGVVGFKPTYGRVPTDGVHPLGTSLDHAGPIARTVADAGLLLSVLLGQEVAPVLPGRLRVGIAPGLTDVRLAPAVQAVLDDAVGTLAALGAEIVQVDVPGARDAMTVYAGVQLAEGLRVHRGRGVWPGRRDEYGDDVRARVEAAEGVSFEHYIESIAARERLRGAFASAFAQADVIVTPVAAGPPARLGEEEVTHDGQARPFREIVLPYTTPHDLTGIPSCAVRAGFDDLGLPVGIQLAGPFGADALVLGAAQAFYDATASVQARWPG